LTPTPGQSLKWSDQPFTLSVKNGIASSRATLTYSFQVATDIAFANIAFSQDGVAEGSGGQTSLKIGTLAGSTSYFWRVHTNSGTSAGLYTTVRQFVVGPQIVIQAPVLSLPANGSTLTSGSLTTNNAARSGPAGQIVYRFDLADSSSFGNIVFSTTVNEQSGGTTNVQVPGTLTTNATYYWRVQAIDTTNSITGPYSSVSSFKYVPFDMSQATMWDSPADLGFWPETAKITNVTLNGDGIQVDFDRRNGSDRWPDAPFGSGSIQYTLGMCAKISSQWNCAAVVLFWYGRELSAGGQPGDVALDWFYGPRWGPLFGYQPADGETVGLFVGSGALRGRTDPGYVNCPRTCERSNVALVPWSENANYTFSLGKILKSSRR
jgi:hypothetical protein